MIEIAIDLGGTFTRIFEKDNGLILEEPSLIAVEQNEDDYDIISIGQSAKKLIGKTGENIYVFSPINEGKIMEEDFASCMLKDFLYKHFTKRQIRFISAVVLCPCGISAVEREKYRNVCYQTGIKKVDIVPKVMCSMAGMDLELDGERSAFLVQIGGNITEVAALFNYSIIKGCTSNVSGNSIDKGIMDFTKEDGLLIGNSTARKIKEDIATLNESENLRYDIVGLDDKTKTPRTDVISTTNVRKIIEPILEEVTKIVQTTANICPPEVASDIVKDGIFVCGGTSELPMLETYLRKNLGVSVFISNDYGRTAILGAGKLLQDKKALNKVIQNF